MPQMASDRLLRAPAVTVLLLVNVVVFIVVVTGGDAVEVLALSGDPEAIVERPWTLLTVFFVHDNVGHLAVMMLMLVVFGTRLETATGPRRLLLTYLVGGLAGSVTAVVIAGVSGSAELFIGSSASMFAIAAALAVVQPRVEILGSRTSHWVIAAIAFNLVSALVWPLGSAGHMAGLSAGAVVGYRMRAGARIDEAATSV